MMKQKFCQNKTCKKRFSVQLHGKSPNAHRKYCYDCNGVKIWARENKSRMKFLQNRWVKLNPEKAKVRYRKHRLKTKYGLTIEGLLKEIRRHRNRCAICRRRFNGRWNKPNIDHKHGEKGTYRGLLCVNCNLLIGFSRESIKILMAAIRYLRRTNGRT